MLLNPVTRFHEMWNGCDTTGGHHNILSFTLLHSTLKHGERSNWSREDDTNTPEDVSAPLLGGAVRTVSKGPARKFAYKIRFKPFTTIVMNRP